MFGSYTWLILAIAALVLFLLIRAGLKSYWKNVTLPPNKTLFQKHFALTYNDVFNDLAWVKTDWKNVDKTKSFTEMVIALYDKDKVRFKGMFTALKFSSLVAASRKMEKLLTANASVLNAGTGPQDEKIIQFYQQHKEAFLNYDKTFSSFLKNVSDLPKPVKTDSW